MQQTRCSRHETTASLPRRRLGATVRPPRLPRLLAGFLLAACVATAGAEEPQESDALWRLASEGRFLELLSRAGTPEPSALAPGQAYLMGLSLQRVHRFEDAAPYLERALHDAYAAHPGWASPEDLLARIETCRSLRPPAVDLDEGLDPRIRLRVYAQQGPWAREIAKRLPALFGEALRVFPGPLPLTHVYLFEERASYDAFYRSLFGTHAMRSWQHGTGRVGAVVFCGRRADGSRHPAEAHARLPADLLHEIGHALCEARFGDLYIERVPQWLNEGMADVVARTRYRALFAETPSRVRAWLSRDAPPSYEQMARQLYEDPEHRYLLARMMVEVLLEGREDTALGALLDEARRTEDFEQALEAVCGRRGPALLAETLARVGPPAKDRGDARERGSGR